MAETQEYQGLIEDNLDDFLLSRLASAFNIRNKATADAWKKKIMQKEENVENLKIFFSEGEYACYICGGQDQASIFSVFPELKNFSKKSMLVLNLSKEKLTAQSIQKDLVIVELSKNILQHLYGVFSDIMAPICQNPANQQGWTDLVTKDLMEKFNSYIAQVYVVMGLIKGRTMLPMPSHQLIANDGRDNTSNKDKAHIFEGSIITWTKQIKNVLKLEPEQVLKSGDPGPLAELEFWRNKAENLNSIHEQLQSQEVKTILKFLESNKSTYTNPFSKLRIEVQNARIEANDNNLFLSTLKEPFEILTDSSTDFVTLHEQFHPIMHTILLIWKKSRFYRTPPRLVVLIREICNAIIASAQNYVDGPSIFASINAKETSEACDKLQMTIDVCTKFKDAYFEYKAQAGGEWKLTTNALFVRLDSFIERAFDILNLTQTIVQFNKLDNIQLGGTKGKTLTENVKQIFIEFEQAVDIFTKVNYDIIDISEKNNSNSNNNFDADFYEFRSKIKELERRLASIITQGFDDNDTINGRLKLLDNFEGLLNRTIIQDELEKKHIVLLEMYKQDLKTVQSIFLDGQNLVEKKHENSPIFQNMPPIAGALTWCKSLRDRIQEPIEKLAQLGQGITDREEFKDVSKLYQSITKSIKEYEDRKILDWHREIEANTEEKLQMNLLDKDENGFLKVNFHDDLVRLLREVKYFLQLGLQVPKTAADIYEKNEIFRNQCVQLNLIVDNYNHIIDCLHPVEEPLVKKKIQEMEIELSPGIEEHKWKSQTIDGFIKKSKGTVDILFETVTKMKSSLDKVKECLEAFNKTIIEKKNKPMAPDDYDQNQKAQFASKIQIVKEQGILIHKQVKEVLDAVKADKKGQYWKNYNDYVNTQVIDGIANAIIKAMCHLNEIIDPELIRKTEQTPLFDISLTLENQIGIIYDPEIEEDDHKSTTVRNIIKGWINDFFTIAGSIHRLDSSIPGDYLQEIRSYFEVKQVMAQIDDHLNDCEEECLQFKNQFNNYSQFWTEDPHECFEKFLDQNEPQPTAEEIEQEQHLKQNPLLKNCRVRLPPLHLFDEKILELKSIQAEIARIPSPAFIRWLKIDLRPMKKDLEKKVMEWHKVYTDFLHNQFKTTLKNLQDFIHQTNEGIKNNPSDEENKEDNQLLMSVMKVISDVKDVEPKAPAIIQRLKDMVVSLKKHQIQIQGKGQEDPLQAIDNAQSGFNETTQKVFQVKSDILPLQRKETIQIQNQLTAFQKEVNEYQKEYRTKLPFGYDEHMSIDEIQDQYLAINNYHQRTLELENRAKEYNELEKLFDLEIQQYKQLKDCHGILKNLKILWDAISLVNFQYNDWKIKPWRTIKADTLEETNKALQQQLKEVPKEVKQMKGYASIVDKVKNMGKVLPLVSSLHGEQLEDRHWQQLKDITGKQFDHKSMSFTFEDILNLQLHNFDEQVNEIVDLATKESAIEKKLKKIEQEWNKCVFEFSDINETKIFQPLDVILEMLDQDSLTLMSMKAQGRNVEYFIEIVEDWREKLSRVDVVSNEFLKVQKNWKILYNIFIKSEDIKVQLPEDSKLFQTVDNDYRELMNEVLLNPLVIEACTTERKDRLEAMSASIKKCEKALNDYLEQKKKAFPRFYFLSNQSLLTILSNGQNAPKVCEYLGDCFDGLQGLKFNNPLPEQQFSTTADAMYSKDGEVVDFQGTFTCEGAVEKWLKDLEYKMRLTLQQILGDAKASSELWDTAVEDKQKRHFWTEGYNAQIALLTTQIVWTEEVTQAFLDFNQGNESAIKDCLAILKSRLVDLISKVRGQMSKLERGKIINIITIDVHGRDVVEKFIVKKITDAESFDWLSQLKFFYEEKETDMASRQRLRFEWEKTKDNKKCIIRIVDWYRYYSYEYVGNAMRLVVTPLTDRCYITLTQALNLTMGGAPAGPAGTGKTETTKDLGRGVGLPVMVFNCSDQMNKDSMAQIFMGLSQSGAWGCFDEFNRISIEVLSVVSTQVKCILDSLKEKQSKFHFMEEGEIELQDTVGFFITMNPGYAGRTELPENLKALFRSCAMVVPDLVLICENMLMSEGFTEARALSRKFVSLYMLSRELLSKQRHYDWGLRAVKSVLRQAGGLKRADPDMPEDPLLMRALRDFNMPKIVTDDKPIFLRLIGDLFPGQNPETKQDPELYKAVQKTAKESMGLIAEDGFVTKVVQLKEILEVRHCVFIIGPSGCGKTMVWKALAKNHNNDGEPCEYDTLNPKSITSDELFGAYTKSKEWKNGVIAVIMKNQVKNEDKYRETHKHKWIILDGDIDPEWIESLNTVMDDNKVLTLVSNDRIPLTPEMRLLFEIDNLRNATPATVSRAGVLFINETDIGWMPYMNQWLDRSVEKVMKKTKEGSSIPESPEMSEIAKFVYYRCFQQYFEAHLSEFHNKERVNFICPMVDIAMVQSICCILDALMLEHSEKLKALEKKIIDKKEDSEDCENALKQHYEAFFQFAGLWGIGGMIGGGQEDEHDMKVFGSLWKHCSKMKIPENQGQVYDFYWNFNEQKWEHWSEKQQTYIPQDEQIFSKIFVSTIHTTRLKYLIDMHVHRKKPIMFIGSAGTGKTAVMKNYLATTNPDKVTYTQINFSSFTDSLALQKNIEGMVEKKAGTTYGSATNKTIICFIDDMNMPYVDKYGTQSPIALLRLIVDYQMIYNREQLEEKKYLQDLLFFASQNQKAGSFQIDLRLQRNFSVFTMYTPTKDIITTIFGSILGAHFATLDPKIKEMCDPLVEATIFLFQQILKTTQFSPSAKKFHYQFNFRELSKVIEGLCRTTPKEYSEPVDVVRLWVHECHRTFKDRMINNEDMNLLQRYIVSAYVQKINNNQEPSQEEDQNPFIEENIHTEFVSAHTGTEGLYVRCKSGNELKKVLGEKLDEYNELKATMNLVLFQQAIEHICRIVRILEMPGGNALLVGVGGSGKQSLTRLSSFILGFEIDQMVVTANFTMNDLKNYLQEIYKKIAKPSSTPRVFMLTDQQIKEETFLIPINDMLNSGWIMDLFTKEESDGMIQANRAEAKGAGVSDQLDQLTNYFLDKMRKQLKVVLCFSPVGEAMRVRSRKFPGIINATIVDWFHPWPKDALIGVASRFIQDIDFPSSEIRDAIALNMAECHVSIDEANQAFLQLERRHNYTTPKSFLELIEFYKKILGEKRHYIEQQIQKYQMGLNILAETQSKVAGLQDELKIKMVEVNKKKEETGLLIDKVAKESEIAQREQEIANVEEEETNKKASEAKDLEASALVALSEAEPALIMASEAVKCLNKNHITEMKSLGSPPDAVKTVARVLLILMGERITLADSDEKVWKKNFQMMANPQQFLKKLEDYDKDNIDDNVLETAKKIIDNPDNQYQEDKMISKNYAASKLCLWSTSIVTYNGIYKKVKPLQDQVELAQATVEQKQKELAIVKEKVRQLNEKVAKLTRDLNEAEIQKKIVEDDAEACNEKLTAAEKLVNGLAGENKRWTQNVKDLGENVISIIGDSLLASEFVSYIGAFSARLRHKLWKETWLNSIIEQKIPITEGIEPLKVLTTEAQMASWKNENLPSDPMSLENAAVITSCSRWPLMIDPQLQGQNWIRGKEGENLTVLSLSQNRWLQQLGMAISAGKAVMIEGIQQEIDATLDPLLSRSVIKKGRNFYIEMGGEQIDYDSNFKLFLVTKLYNPHFRPEIAAQCTIINFIVTESGLEEQLLATVVNIEKNELEMQKQELVKQQNEYSVKLNQMEQSLLETLASADSSTILENKELIQKLDETKKTTTIIQEQSALAKKTEESINIEREFYRPVAAEGAMLYFLVIALSVMDHMYQYSLESFVTFFLKAINATKQKGEERIPKLILNIRKEVYQWISRGLFERHKLIFLTLITFRLMQKKMIDVTFEQLEMDFLINAAGKPGVVNTLEWLPTANWDMVQGMCALEEFKSFSQNLEKDAPSRFKEWYNELAPENIKLPLDWKKLDQMPFKKLLVLRCLRPDRITAALTEFIKKVLPEGQAFVEMDQNNTFQQVLVESINDADTTNPIFFILSPGSDPVKQVEAIAKKESYERGKSFFDIALGQGQDEIARRRIEEGNREGHWVMLQNIHLMPNWLLELEKILDGFAADTGSGNPRFKLFLSAEPSLGVPIGILDRSIKLTNEPPSGLRANMTRAWTFFSKEEIEEADPKQKAILFALCFFHSTLIERKRFGAKGWNMSYPFNMGDLRDSYAVMSRYLTQSQEKSAGKLPFDDLIYIFGEIMYGGHIVDGLDRILCNSYLFNIMNEKLFDESELFPYIEGKGYSFKVPSQSPYEKYLEHIEQSLAGQETPLAYGLHPNAEIGFRTTQCVDLFRKLQELQPKDTNAEAAGEVKTPQEATMERITYILDDKSYKAKIFNLDEIKGSIDIEFRGPYQNVFLQELEYMNNLIIEIVKSLEGIKQGFAGLLTITEQMESVIDSIYLNRVPVPWQALAYPSKRGLSSWLMNLEQRWEQLDAFKQNPIEIPKCIMISRFFNPQSFLTAIMQVVGRDKKLELNKLYISTEIQKKQIEEIDTYGKDGSYVYGFIVEGARWDMQAGTLDECKPKEMFSVLPVVLCKAQLQPAEGKEDKSLYQCPAYKTEDRGNSFVFMAQLKTMRAPPRKWILAGVAIIMDVEGFSDDKEGVEKK